MIQEKIKSDLKQAMLSKNSEVKDLLRVVIGEFNREGKEVDDAKATSIIKKMVQNAKDQENFREVNILEEYLPKQMDDVELENVCKEYILSLGDTSMKDMGKVMGYLKDNYSGQYDGKSASSIVRNLLV